MLGIASHAGNQSLSIAIYKDDAKRCIDGNRPGTLARSRDPARSSLDSLSDNILFNAVPNGAASGELVNDVSTNQNNGYRQLSGTVLACRKYIEPHFA